MQGGSEGRVVGKVRKRRLRDIGWEIFQVDLNERRWDDGVSVYDVEHLNEKYIENVQSAAEDQIGYVRVSRRKEFINHGGMMKQRRLGRRERE